MIYIENIKVAKNASFPGSEVLKKNWSIKCNDVNLLVGDQGCGKSTLLSMLQSNNEGVEIQLSELAISKGVSSYYFDSEKDNPRINSPERYTTPSGADKGIGYGGALYSRFHSHGEVLVELVVGLLDQAKGCVLLMDEPESGLSITNQFRLIESIKEAVKRDCQFFIATHCYPLIEEFDVISLEHNKQMAGIDFIDRIAGELK